MNAKQLFYIVLTGLAFGSSLVASRFGVSQVEPVSFVTARLIMASLGFFAIYALDHRRHPWPTQPQLWRHSLIVAIFGSATLGGVLLLGEIVTGWMAAGMAIILICITLTTYNPLSAKRLHLRLR